MNEQSKASEEAEPADAGVPERAGVLKDTLHLSPETARAAAQDESATGMRKPAATEVDEERAARARATEPGGGETPHR